MPLAPPNSGGGPDNNTATFSVLQHSQQWHRNYTEIDWILSSNIHAHADKHENENTMPQAPPYRGGGTKKEHVKHFVQIFSDKRTQ